MTLEQTRAALNNSSIRQLQRWLAECEKEHPSMINTEAMIKDEIRRREQIGRIKFRSAGAVRKR